jgi:hypothetical protein
LVEFSAQRGAEECIPFAGCEPENWAFSISAVANTDHAIGQGRDFNTVAVCETQRAFNPPDLLHSASPWLLGTG